MKVEKEEDIMNVAQYTFQSPSSSPVQVGKIVPSSIEQDKPKEAPSAKAIIASTAKSPEQWLKDNAAQTQKVKPTVTTQAIDTYA